MAEYYNIVLDEDELRWFFEHIIEKPLEYESYMILLACRGKNLTEEEREYTKVGSRGEMMKEQFISCKGGLKQEWNFDIYKQAFYSYNCDKRSLLTTVFDEFYSMLNKTGEKLFGLGNFAIIKTNGGFHTLVRKEALKFDPRIFINEVMSDAENKMISEYIAEFIANDSSHKSKDGKNIIKRSAFIPTPGCRQYDSYPVVMNKEDFEK